MVPWGLLGLIPGARWLRFLIIFKILRVRLFLRIFEYKNYHIFFKMIFHFKLEKEQLKDKGNVNTQVDYRLEVDKLNIF